MHLHIALTIGLAIALVVVPEIDLVLAIAPTRLPGNALIVVLGTAPWIRLGIRVEIVLARILSICHEIVHTIAPEVDPKIPLEIVR